MELLVKDRPWSCERCLAEYDRPAIESSIIATLQKRITAYQLQDLRCSRCKQLKSDNLRLFCECSGEYALAENKLDLGRWLTVVGNVGQYHSLTTLELVIQATRGMIGV